MPRVTGQKLRCELLTCISRSGVRTTKDVTNDKTKVAAVQHELYVPAIILVVGGGVGLLCPLFEREEALVTRETVVLISWRKNRGAGCGRRCSRGTRFVRPITEMVTFGCVEQFAGACALFVAAAVVYLLLSLISLENGPRGTPRPPQETLPARPPPKTTPPPTPLQKPPHQLQDRPSCPPTPPPGTHLPQLLTPSETLPAKAPQTSPPNNPIANPQN